MKKYKNLLVLPLLALLCIPFSRAFSGQSKITTNTTIVEVKPPYVPPVTPDEPKNIKEISILNFPEEGVKIGYFDEANIELKYLYTDETFDIVPLKERDFPDSFRENVLGEVGDHYIKLLIRGVEVSYNFKMLESDRQYTVIFADFDDTIISTQIVKHNHRPVYPSSPYRPQDSMYRYTFSSWDFDGVIDEDKIIKPVYISHEKYRSFVPTQETVLFSKNESSFDLYLGRFYKVPVYHTATSYRNLYEEITINYDIGENYDEYNNFILKGFKYLYNFDISSHVGDVEYVDFEKDDITIDKVNFGVNFEEKTVQTKDSEYIRNSSQDYEDYFYFLAEKTGSYVLDNAYNGGMSGYYMMCVFMDFDISMNISYSYNSLYSKYVFTLNSVTFNYSQAFKGIRFLGNYDLTSDGTEHHPYSSEYKIDLEDDVLKGIVE